MNVSLDSQITHYVIDEFKLKQEEVLFCIDAVREEHRKRKFDTIVKTGALLEFYEYSNVKKWCYNKILKEVPQQLQKRTIKKLIRKGLDYYTQVLTNSSINNSLIKKGVKYHKKSSQLLPNLKKNSFTYADDGILIDVFENEYKYLPEYRKRNLTS